MNSFSGNYNQGRPWRGANSSIELGLPNFSAQNNIILFFYIYNAPKILIYTNCIEKFSHESHDPSVKMRIC